MSSYDCHDEDINTVRDRLYRLVDTQPSTAISKARRLPNLGPDWLSLRAGILCDGGAADGNLLAVDEAIEVFEELNRALPNLPGNAYNLANALWSRALLEKPHGLKWYLRTSTLTSRARALYWLAARQQRDYDKKLASQTVTNLGNMLDAAHRWIEAYDCYMEALDIHPQNGVASGIAARVLLRVGRYGAHNHRTHLVGLAHKHAQHAKDNLATVREFGGEQAVATIQGLPSDTRVASTLQSVGRRSRYEAFVAKNRLYLTPVLDGVAHDRQRWDDAHVRLLIERTDAGPEVPPVIAMINEIKADYLVARDLLYQGLKDPPAVDETGLYLDTLDYATYGMLSSRLVLAQRSSLDLLDKIAVVINDYFNLGMSSDRVTFINVWRERRSADNWHPGLSEALKLGNPGLVALSEISADLLAKATHEEPPMLSAERRARNTGTHRFTVLHDMATGSYRPSEAIDHHDLGAFQKLSLRTLKLARAAYLHLLEAVYFDSVARQADAGTSLPLSLRSHHYIRGE